VARRRAGSGAGGSRRGSRGSICRRTLFVSGLSAGAPAVARFEQRQRRLGRPTLLRIRNNADRTHAHAVQQLRDVGERHAFVHGEPPHVDRDDVVSEEFGGRLEAPGQLGTHCLEVGCLDHEQERIDSATAEFEKGRFLGRHSVRQKILRILQASTRAASFFAGRKNALDGSVLARRLRAPCSGQQPERHARPTAVDRANVWTGNRPTRRATDAVQTRKRIERQTDAPLAEITADAPGT
jgi:hypothetical protein